MDEFLVGVKMSNANDIHSEIMEVVNKYIDNSKCSYADVFGALGVTKTFFELKYAAQLAMILKTVEHNERL